MTTPVRIKRSQFATFMNTTPSTTATYKKIALGATSLKETMNPKTTSETYLDQQTATITVDSYAPTAPVKLTAFKDEDIFEYIKDLKDGRAILGDAETDIVQVNLFDTPTLNEYPAYKQAVSIAVDDFGDEGGVRMQLNFTLNYQGAPVAGTFNPTTLAFTPNP